MGKTATTCGLWIVALLASPAALADQTTAQQDAQKIHDNGSNNSLNESYGNALHALSNFYDLNIPGAISHGIKAYGQYRNSQAMDDLRDRNQKLAGSMSTAGTGAVSASTVTNERYVSPYARLDTKFLYEGDTGEVAARLEKMSGLSRAKMFQMAVDLHTNSKSPTDPNFMEWGMKSYKDLVAQVPNDDFRSKLETFGGMAESAITSGFAKATLAKFISAGAAAPTQMVAKLDDRAPASAGTAEAAPVPNPVAVAATPAATGEENPLSGSLGFSARGSATTGVNRSLIGLDRLGNEPVDGFLGDAMRSARESAAEPNLFSTVSNKLRELTARQQLGRRTVAQLPSP